MTHEEQMREITDAVDTWCPSAFDHESFANRALRAFLNARACVLDQRRVLAGTPPIRPLSDYPAEPDLT